MRRTPRRTRASASQRARADLGAIGGSAAEAPGLMAFAAQEREQHHYGVWPVINDQNPQRTSRSEAGSDYSPIVRLPPVSRRLPTYFRLLSSSMISIARRNTSS